MKPAPEPLPLRRAGPAASSRESLVAGKVDSESFSDPSFFATQRPLTFYLSSRY